MEKDQIPPGKLIRSEGKNTSTHDEDGNAYDDLNGAKAFVWIGLIFVVSVAITVVILW